MRSRRLWGVVSVVTVAAIAMTCVRSSTELCSDGSRCANGLQCVDLADGSARCARQEQLDACAGLDATTCMLDDVPGLCLGGACFLSICGDGVIDEPEVCDDSNRVDGDGCSSTCGSLETCGNGVIDLIAGEQCDEGLTTLAGDGCSLSCVREYRLWRTVTPGVPAIRSGHGVVTDPVRGVLMFGGGPGLLGSTANTVNGAGTFNDTWRWDGVTWSELSSARTPPARAHFSIAFDPRRRRVVVFGGFDSTGNRLNDTWEWDGVIWTDVSTAKRPALRAGASLACNTTACYLFGGQKGSGSGSANYHADTWSWDGSAWSLAATSGPGARWRAPMVATSDRIVLFSGQPGTPSLLNDTWEFTSTWAQRTITGPMMGSNHSTMAHDAGPQRSTPILVANGQTYSLGATAWQQLASGVPQTSVPSIAFDRASQQILSVGTTLGDQWATAVWNMTWASTNRQFPVGGTSSSIAYDALRGVNVLLTSGGTWEWNGSGLRRALPAGPQAGPQSMGGAIAFDRACGTTYAFGGGSGASRSEKTWSYEPTAPEWVEVPIAQPPPHRDSHAMVYDEQRQVVVVFGGAVNPGTQSSDVYELGGPCNARAWQLITPSGAAPSPRSGPKMAYDARRKVTVMFGGRDVNAELGDTWEWNGATWTDRTPVASPEPRNEHAMAYDPRRQRVVLFGGRSQGAQLDDSWEWNGDAGTWERLAPAINPTRRSAMVMAPDVTGGLVAIGGQGVGGTSLTEVVRLSSELSTHPQEACVFATADSDGDGLAGCADPDCGARCHPLCPPGVSCAGPHCGDGTCSAVEDYLLCPADCVPP